MHPTPTSPTALIPTTTVQDESMQDERRQPGPTPTFLDALERVRGGGTALDPHVVAQLLVRTGGRLAELTPREREVLALMAEGHSNAAIAATLVVTDGAVEKHTQRIFAKLGLHQEPDAHRRVRAVLDYLDA